jgi:hypothetical protein
MKNKILCAGSTNLVFVALAELQEVHSALFSSTSFYQNFRDSPSHQIFKRMHEVLNIDKKIKLITQFRRNGRDESFKPN